MSSTRVVVTGLGTTSPVGGDAPSTWDALVNGRSGVRFLTDDWAEEMPVKIAGRIAVEPTEVLELDVDVIITNDPAAMLEARAEHLANLSAT